MNKTDYLKPEKKPVGRPKGHRKEQGVVQTRKNAMLTRLGKNWVPLPDDWETITIKEAIRRQKEEREWT